VELVQDTGVIVASGSNMSEQHLHNLAMRLAAVERKVDALFEHLGIAPPEPTNRASARVVELVRSGKTIDAIKLYREETGCDLATAKREVEGIL